MNITDEGMLEVDIHEIIEQNFNSSSLNFTLQTFDLKTYFPGLDFDQLGELARPIEDENSIFDGLSLKDLVDGDLKITGANILQFFENTNLTTLRIPIKPTIEGFLDISSSAGVPTELALNFTIVDSFAVPKGKFGNTLGNVALVDCHYINRLFMSSYQNFFSGLIESQPFLYVALT